MDNNITLGNDMETPPNSPDAVHQALPRLTRQDNIMVNGTKLDLLSREFNLEDLKGLTNMEQLPSDIAALVDEEDGCPDECDCHNSQGTQTDKVSKHVCNPKSANFKFKLSPRGIVTSLNCAQGSTDCDVIKEHSGTNEAVNEAVADVMKFADDADVTKNMADHESKDVEMDFNEITDPSIEGILSRPQFMFSYNWSSNANASSFPSKSFPATFLQTSNIARAKLDDYKYLRCNFKFRFTLNASPFAQGRLLFYVVPLKSLAGSRNSREGDPDDRTQATIYRGVELDIGSADTCELEVPFLAPHSAVDLTKFDYSLFELHAIPLAALHVGSDVSAQQLKINVYASIHDVKLALPTTKPMQEGYLPANASMVTDSVHNLGEMTLKNNMFGVPSGTRLYPYGETYNNSHRFWFKTQAGNTRTTTIHLDDIPTIFNYKNTLDRIGPSSIRVTEHTGVEAEQQSTGVVSGVMDKISRASGKFVDVPFIGSYARSVSWISELVGGAAKIFGFSKPTSVAAVTPCTIVPAKNFTNVDAIDNSVVLGSSVNNSISGHDRFGCKEDEMAIPYVVSRSQLVKKFFWEKTFSRGSSIATIPVNPTYCEFKRHVENNTDNVMDNIVHTVWAPTAAGYVASMFKWWRGSIRYRISFAKTKFHSGRIRVTWHPHADDPPSEFTSTSSHTRIYDIRESNEIEFEVPYHGNQPFRRVHFNTHDNDERGANGFISLQVENALVAPDQVHQNITMLIFQSMNPNDTAFHTPSFCNMIPGDIVPAAWEGTEESTVAEQSGMRAKLCENINCNRVIVEHSGIIGGGQEPRLRSDNDHNPVDVLAPALKTPVYAPGKLVGGECVRSLRALSRRFGLATVFKRNKNNAEDFVLDTINYDTTPISYDATDIDAVDGQAGNPTAGDCNAARYGAAIMSPLSYISRMYRLYAGGRRYKIDSGALAADSVVTSTMHIANDGPSFAPTDDSAVATAGMKPEAAWFQDAGTFRHVTANHTNQFHEIEVPYAQTTSVAPLVNGLPLHEIERPTVHVNVKGPDSGTANVPIYEAAADDHSFGCLITPPFLYSKGDSVPREALKADLDGPKSALFGATEKDVVGKPFTYLSFDWTVSKIDSRKGTVRAYRNDAGKMVFEDFTLWSLIDARRNGQLSSTQLTLDALLSSW